MSAGQAATTIALCWRAERRDGVAIGLTGHDRDLTVGGFRYRAAPGMTPSAIERSDGLEADTADVAGALSAEALSAADLAAGRWDGARIRVFAADWRTGEAIAELGEGTIGAVAVANGGFTAELRGATAMLDRPVAEETSATCRAALGDRRCRVAMAGRRRFARVLATEGEAGVEAGGTVLTLDAAEPAADAYGGGLLRWFGGANCGIEQAVAASAGQTVTLRAPPPFVPEAGALVEVVQGCDKTLATCAARFGNSLNFRGEPFLPGIDLLTRYPGQ